MDLDEWLARATSRIPLAAADGKSGSLLERLVVDGTPYVLKHVVPDDDWILRALRDDGTAFARMWESGVLDRLPHVVDPVVVDVFTTDRGVAILMEDVSEHLVPEGDTVVPVERHRRFIEHIAALHAAYWGWQDDLGLVSMDRRYTWFAPARMEREVARADAAVPPLAVRGWTLLPSVSPPMAEVVLPLHDDPRPLTDAFAAMPPTLVHGDVKFGNLGSRPDGRTILLDWALPGSAPCTYDLAHYLALNNARLAEPKEAVIEAYRAALEAAGVATDPWFDDQVALSSIGHMMLLGWEKALGGEGDELRWWEQRVVDAAPLLSPPH